MATRLGLDARRVHPVPNGIRVQDFEPAETPPDPPVIGYLARMSGAKGLATLVDAFVRLAREDRVPGVRLRIAGARTAADRLFTRRLERRVRAAGLADRVSWHPNVAREEKSTFLRGLSAFSVPATYGEAFGLYVLEAMAAGVPVVQPRHGAFPEILEATGGGVLCEPDDPADLARALSDLLLDPVRARELGRKGLRAVRERFTVRRMAEGVLEVFRTACPG
jgi:glycosyltransferase involved in cell wall biosynthesis